MFRKILLKGVLSAACVVSLLSDGALAKSYDLNKVIIMSRIGADGSLRIEESRTYQFQGRFSWADYHLPLKQLGTVEDFSIREGSQMYDARGDEEPGTYQTRISDNEFYAKWFYQARDETRTFVLNYTVTPAVNKYADVAEFYYKFVGEANPTRIDTVEVTIHLPQTADTTFTRAWAHGALWGDLRFENGDVKMSVSPLPAHQYWEVRVVFPNNWIGEALPTIGEAALPAILADEAKWARTANEQRRQELQRLRQSRENEKKAWPIAVGALALGLLGVAFLYFSFGRGFHVPYQQKIDSNMPRDLHPALASFLYFQKQMTGNALMATVLHLAEKGVIKIEEGATSPKRRFGSRTPHFLMKLVNANWRSDTSLLDFEISLLGFLFDDLGNGAGQIEFDDLKKNQKKVRRWFEGWQRLVKAHVRDQPYWDRASIKATMTAALLSVLVIAGGIFIQAKLGPPGLLAIGGGVACLAFAFAILRYTPETKLLRRKLAALRRYLKNYHFSSAASRNFLESIQNYLIFGVALGVGSKPIQQLLASVPPSQQQVYFPWYISTAHTSVDSFAHAVSSFVAVANSAMSSAAGVGGGAAAGGGGGAGGASGGAG